MSAAALWIYLPFFTGVLLLLLYREKRFCLIASLMLTGFLSWVALRIPVNSMLVFNRISLIFTASTKVLGRTISIDRADQTLVAFFYAFAFCWIFCSIFMKVYRFFIPTVLMSTALLIGVIAVKPFIYGIFLQMICALVFLPMLHSGQEGNEEGLFRFLLYQLGGMIFLAVSGKLTNTVDINPKDVYLLKRAVVLIFTGMSLWLAVFPFFSWIAVLFEKSCPFTCGFVISLLQFSALFILLQFLNDYLWLRTYEPLFRGMRLVGVLLLNVSAVWSLFQKNLQRVMAFMITAENGVSILLLGTNSRDGIDSFLSLLLIHALGWMLWAVCVKMISEDSALELEQLRGLGYARPYLCAGLLLAHFTISGLPLFAGFPERMKLLSACFSHSAVLGWTTAVSCGVLVFSGLRLMLIFLSPLPENASFSGYAAYSRRQVAARRLLLILGMLLLLLIGFFPSLLNVFISGIRSQYALIFG